MMYNETIGIVESKSSDVEILDMGALGGIGIAFGIALAATIGFIIRLLFIYYIKYEAPKQRAINTLMLHDQVSHFHILF